MDDGLRSGRVEPDHSGKATTGEGTAQEVFVDYRATVVGERLLQRSGPDASRTRSIYRTTRGNYVTLDMVDGQLRRVTLEYPGGDYEGREEPRDSFAGLDLKYAQEGAR